MVEELKLGPDLPKLTFEDAVKQALGRSRDTTITRLATAEGAERTASELGVPLSVIQAYVEYWVLALKCQPPTWLGDGKVNPSGLNLRQHVKRSEQLALVKTNCGTCGITIEGGAERVFLSATVLRYDYGENGPEPQLTIFGDIHCCLKCSAATKDFSIPNRLHISAEEIRRRAEKFRGFAEQMRQTAKVEERADAAWNTLVKRKLAAGDTHPFNLTFPTFADPDDLMARAEPFSDMARRATARNNQGSGEITSASEVADSVASTDTPDAMGGWVSHYGVGSQSAGFDRQRKQVDDYLKSHASKGKLSEDERAIAKMFVLGMSLREIDKKTGNKHSSTTHDRLKKVKKLAYKPR